MKHVLTLLLGLSFTAAALAQTPNTTPTISQLFSFSCNANFSACPEGMDPTLSLIQLSDGNFYGVTWWAGQGNANAGGTVVKITPSGAVTVLKTFDPGSTGKFPEGENPVIGLAVGTDGALYGVTESGGSANQGVMYRLTSSGSFEVEHNFCSLTGCPDGPGPLTLGNDGNFYGTELSSIFRITPEGTWSLVHSLNPTTEGSVGGALTLGKDGNFYGTGEIGSACERKGTIFRVTPSGTFTILHRFPDLEYATSNLVQASDGNFYGGADGGIFRMTSSGTFKIIHVTTQAEGYSPTQLLQASDGNLWGLAISGGISQTGTLFAVTTGGKSLTYVAFDCATTGCSPEGMVQGSDGNFYGMAISGGTAPSRNSEGTAFKVEAGLTPPVR